VTRHLREPYAPLPLSDAFYALLSRVGKAQRLQVDDTTALAAAVARLSHVYTRGRDALAEHALGPDAELARLGFFLPRDLAKVLGPLAELARARPALFARPLRLLDVGAGLGSTSLGVARYLRLARHGCTGLSVDAVERDARALGLFQAIAAGLPGLGGEFAPLSLRGHTRDAREALPSGPFDLITCGLVLNELTADGAAATGGLGLLDALIARLAPDGALIVLEPALKTSARALMATRDALVAVHPDLALIAPCVHRGACPMLANERDFCHESLPFALPPRLAEVARAAGLRYEGLSYSALVLARGEAPDRAQQGITYRVVSDPLPSKGKRELYGCGSPGYVRLSLLDRERSAASAPFEDARRGDTLWVASEAARLGAGEPLALQVGPRAVAKQG
jgi:ribosomal protein RSM22 (predicted rRNA methylase)